MITDRDITVRATSAGRSPADCRVADVMSVDVQYCYEDDELHDAAAHMKSLQVRRLPVVNRANRLVGLLSLGDMATRGAYGEAAETLRDVSDPSEPDRNT
jgi:CBS domain-containing protein